MDAFSAVLGALNTGFLQTLKLFTVTLVGAIPLGLVVAFGSMSRWTPFYFLGIWMQRRLPPAGEGGDALVLSLWQSCLRHIADFFQLFRPVALVCRLLVWIIRGTPLMLQLLIIFYIPGYILKDGSPWPSGETGRFLAAAAAFIINYACYFSVIYRGGIEGVPLGQQEAGQVLGMTKSQIFRHVTMLQMIKRIVPPMSNEVITLVKDTSIARIISFQEVIWAGYAFLKGSHGYSGLVWPLFFTGVYFLVFNGLLTLLFGWVERKLSYFQ